ncbi:hypothetical protein SAMN05880501_104159 [Ureibacillus xyleni]|uniref:Uncharacterized protein n=1 Tax=Ureibacillus xyleni TaxID=614648 RepID=A0A285SEL7_9BACL|nr:hypothetical protein [Ureibacillus xyleni]SOC06015.1 hypothetical protein SAMN05880501_104159 [Ureibacillus xyleni]
MFSRKKEARYAAGLNFDIENVEPFLHQVSRDFLDSGFNNKEIEGILSEIHLMKEDHEQKELGTFEVIFKGKPTNIRIIAEIHIEDDSKEVVLYFYSVKKLVKKIDKLMMQIGEELY